MIGFSVTHVATTLAGALLSGVWEGAVLAFAVALALRLMPGVSAAVRSAVWLGVLAMLGLLPVLAGLHAVPTRAFAPAPVRAGAGWALALVGAWAGFMLLRAVQLVRSALGLRGIWRRARPLDAVQLSSLACSASGRRVQVCASDEIAVPSVIGFLAPRIVLPAALSARLSPDELRTIVLHEAEHLRRGDDWTNLLQKLAVVVFPLHPVVLWVETRLCRERELACDDGVLRATHAPRGYATTLASLAEFALIRRGVSLALGAWGRRPELLERVERILSQPARAAAEPSRRLAMAVAGAVLLAAATGSVELARSPQLVSFSGSFPLSASAVPNAARLSPGTPASGFAAYRAENVSFHPATVARASAFRAVMGQTPSPAPSRAVSPTRGRRRTRAWRVVSVPGLAVSRSNATRPPQSVRAASFVVLTSWRFGGSEGAAGSSTAGFLQEQPAVYEGVDTPMVHARVLHTSSAFAYAAVPVEGGWLIVQL